MARVVRRRKRKAGVPQEQEDPYIYTSMTSGEKDSWKACAEALAARHCKAEVSYMPSGCPIFRVPKDQAHKLDHFGFVQTRVGEKRITAPYKIPHRTRFETASVFQYERPFDWYQGEWKALNAVSDEQPSHIRRFRRRTRTETPVSDEQTTVRRRRKRSTNGAVLPPETKKRRRTRTKKL